MKKQASYWQDTHQFPDPVAEFRQRHPNVRLHLSVDEDSLETFSSPSQVDRLIAYLKSIDSSGLDVLLGHQSDLDALSQVLNNYQKVLYGNYLGLSITVDSRTNSIVNHKIYHLVDNIFLIPNVVATTERQEMIIPTKKLIIGLPSVIFTAPDLQDGSAIPSLNELCHGLNLKMWKPRIEPDGQVVWSHTKKNWKFIMQTGQAVSNGMASIQEKHSMAGIMLFDITFRPESNPVCSRHRRLFVDSIHQAAGRLGYGTGRRLKREPGDDLFTPMTQSQVKVMQSTNHLGKILIFAVGDEDEKFRKYYKIIDEASLLQSPVVNIVLGYDDSGKIYDLYQQMPQEISKETISKTIHLYFVDKILANGGASAFGLVEQHPPSLLFYPNTINSDKVTPFLISWVKIKSQTVQPIQRKTRIPSDPAIRLNPTTTSTTTVASVGFRSCLDNQGGRCFIPPGLMEILNLDIRPSTTTTTTRKTTTMRPTTAKPEVPINPNARAASDLQTWKTESTTTSPQQIWSFTLPPSVDQTGEEVDSRMANPLSKRKVICNWETKNSFLSCKIRNRRFINTVRKQKTIHTLAARSTIINPSDSN